jgi:hypothetical protein
MPSRTKNDVAWEQLFEKYSILDIVKRNGCFEINSSQINEFRESRLMSKFDHCANLPEIFKANSLSILPISRFRYVIGNFESHYNLNSIAVETELVTFPGNIQSINFTDLYSESIALNCAHITGIIDILLGEKSFLTVSGRMSTRQFNFQINNVKDINCPYNISVDNSQCEIDAGFESQHSLMLIEAKNYSIKDFLIRQLYYPYRLWESRLSKKILPTLMTFSNDVFSFFIFEFENLNSYNSLRLLSCRKFIIEPEPILRDDIAGLLSFIDIEDEPTNIPLPQADSFERIVDLVSLLFNKSLTKDEITENYQFDIRQTQYYTDAARYLGLVEKYNNTDTGEIAFKLTARADEIFSKNHKQKYLALIERILKHRAFLETFMATLELGKLPSLSQVTSIIQGARTDIGIATAQRRARTVRSWVDWIWDQASD